MRTTVPMITVFQFLPFFLKMVMTSVQNLTHKCFFKALALYHFKALEFRNLRAFEFFNYCLLNQTWGSKLISIKKSNVPWKYIYFKSNARSQKII